MAIKLSVQETAVSFSLSDQDVVSLASDHGIPIYPEDYTGAYEVTPGRETQTLNTSGLMMTGNVKINPIPSNYGLITWNGSVLTVS